MLLYQEAIDTVLSVRLVAPKLFFEGSELMRLAEQLLRQVHLKPIVLSDLKSDDLVVPFALTGRSAATWAAGADKSR